MKKFSLGDFWPMLFVSAVGVGLIWLPFHVLAEREAPIDSVTEVALVTFVFVLFVPFGIYSFWTVASAVAALLLASFWWGHLKERMRKEDVLHILGEPAWKNEDGTDITGARKTTWYYRYRWFALCGYVEFAADDTVRWIQLPRGKPEGHHPGEFGIW